MIDASFDENFDLQPNESTGDYEFRTGVAAFNQILRINVTEYFQEIIGSTDKEQAPKIAALKTAEIASNLSEYADSIAVINAEWVDGQKTQIEIVVHYELGDNFPFTI